MDRREFISLGAATTACLISGCRTASWSRAGLFSMTVLNPKCMAGGAGLCVVMRTPGGKTYLFDTANGDIYGKSPRNNGKDIIAPWLVAHGVEKIDGLIISHYHADHFGGFLWLWNHFPIERVFDCSYMMQVDGLTPHDIREYESARDALSAWEKAHPGKLVRNAGVGTDLGWDEPGLSFELLWPDPRNYVTPKKLINEGFPYHDMLNANSNALRVVYGERTFLVGGDCATMYVTEYLRPALEKAGKWGCDFCVLPGHGIGDYSEDMASMSPRPRVTVASLGDRPWMIEAGAKSQAVMTKAGFESYTTNIHGHITAVSDGHSLDIMHFDDVAKPPSSKRVLFLGDSITDKRL